MSIQFVLRILRANEHIMCDKMCQFLFLTIEAPQSGTSDDSDSITLPTSESNAVALLH